MPGTILNFVHILMEILSYGFKWSWIGILKNYHYAVVSVLTQQIKLESMHTVIFKTVRTELLEVFLLRLTEVM